MSLDVKTLTGDSVGENAKVVEQIKKITAGLSDSLPFVLVPVRIETRFVQVEMSAPRGQSATSSLGSALGEAAAAAEALAARDYATVLPAGKGNRKAYRREVEDPLVNAAQQDLATLATSLETAAAALRTASEGGDAEIAAVDAAADRLSQALPAAQSALGQVRSGHYRSAFLADISAAADTSAPVIASARTLPAASAKLFSALRADDQARIVFTDPNASTDSASDAATLGRARLVDTAQAHTELIASIAAVKAQATQLRDMSDLVARQLHLDSASVDITRQLQTAQEATATMAVIPSQWRDELLSQADELADVVSAMVSPLAASHNPTVADIVSKVNRLRDQLSAQATGDLGKPIAVTAAATQLTDQLRVRIFPDDIAIVTHEEGLTSNELAAGTAFWKSTAEHGGDETAKRAAWRALVGAYGAPRAAWIARSTQPSQEFTRVDIQPAIKSLLTLHKRLDEATITRLGGMPKAVQAAQAAIEALPSLTDPALRRLRGTVQDIRAKADALAATAARPPDRWHPLDDAINHLVDTTAALSTQHPDVLAKLAPADTPPSRDSAWTEAPTADLMPQRFVVVTVTGDSVTHVIAGNPLPKKLVVGLDPSAEEAVGVDTDNAIVVDPSLRWLIDYGAAEELGMAVSVPLTPAEAATGLDRVYVLGISDADPEEAMRQLATVLDNHHYGPAGLSLLPVGSATNSTLGRASAYRGDDDADRSFDVELGAPLAAAGSDGARLASALGISSTLLDHVEYADGHDIGDAVSANKALWPGTAGYALEELLGSVVSVDTRDRIRQFAIDNVIGRGAVPALRVGRQPYGVLVTSAYTRFIPDGGDAFPSSPSLSEAERQRRFEILLRDVLKIMYADWTKARVAGQVQHAFAAANGQDQVLDVLGLDAGSVGYDQRFSLNAGRRGLGGGLHVGLPSGSPSAAMNAGPFALLQRFLAVAAKAKGLPNIPPITTNGLVASEYSDIYNRLDSSRGYEVRYLNYVVPLAAQMAVDTSPGRITALLQESLEDMARDAASPETGQALAVLLVRQALLVQARDVAMRIFQQTGNITEEIRNRTGAGDWFRFVTLLGPHDVTRWSFLLAELSVLDHVFVKDVQRGPGSIYDYLNAGSGHRMHQYLDHRGSNALFSGFNGSPTFQSLVNTMVHHAAAVSELGALSTDKLQQVASEHLDVCSYRLDAWLLGLGVSRLGRMRAKAPEGLHLGAFGWVDDLRPKEQALPPATTVPDVLDNDPQSPIRFDPHNGGFIHAPSPAHAATAAILRAGYNSHRSVADSSNRMAVNVSSNRVHRALALIEGIGSGNDLGALLGYQFERDLHDAFEVSGIVLDDFIPALREAFPSVVNTDGSAAGTAPRHVVDGSRLLTAVRTWIESRGALNSSTGTLLPILRANSHALYPYGLVASTGTLLPAKTDVSRLDAFLSAVDRLADSVDAISDIYVTEGVHQLVEGNQARAAAVLGALGAGRAPPHPEVVDTPSPGTRVTHRVILQFALTTDLPTGWTSPTPRAAAEPALNHWLGGALGPSGMTRTRVATEDGTWSVDVNLTALNLQPIDLLAILEGGFDDGLVELASRLVDTQRPLDVRDSEPVPTLVVDLERDPAWPAEVRSLGETAAMLESVTSLVRAGRAAGPVDYVLADTQKPSGSGVEEAELDTRLNAAGDAMTGLGLTLLSLLGNEVVNDPVVLVGDVGGWVTAHADTYRGTATDDGRFGNLDGLWARRSEFHDALLQSLGFGITSALPPTEWKSRQQVASAMLQAAEGAVVEVARRLTAAAHQSGAQALHTLFGSSLPILPRFTPSNVEELGAALAASSVSQPELAVQRWMIGAAAVREPLSAFATIGAVAAAFGTSWPLAQVAQLPTVPDEPWLGESAATGPGDRVSLVLFGAENLDTGGQPSVGFLVDQWTELIAAEQLTTGVSFNYDQPDAMPPQALLVAVPPAVRSSWQWEDLIQTLHDTFELALNRAVEPVHLQDDVYGQLLPAVIGDIPPRTDDSASSSSSGGLSDHRVVLDFGASQPGGGH